MTGRCTIYATRPEHCRTFPLAAGFMPPKCTYTFEGARRSGTCQPDVCGDDICCAYPRLDGEPLAMSAAPPIGQPCKHLTRT